MPPRFAYWTIIAGGLPTAFRAADRDELMPTFQRLKATHRDAVLKYFAQGKLWDSPEDARRATRARVQNRERRGRDWRPGGEHRDPRQSFKDSKKARNQAWRSERWRRRTEGTGVSQGQTDRPTRRPARFKPQGDRWRDDAFRGGMRRSSDRRRQDGPDDPTRPPQPGREPPPRRDPKPGPPPRPSEPAIKPPGPPERGRTPRHGGRRKKKGQG